MGAIAEGGERVMERNTFEKMGVSKHDLEEVEERERRELDLRTELVREGRPRRDRQRAG